MYKSRGAPGVRREEKNMSAFSHISLLNEPKRIGELNILAVYTR